MTMTYCRSCGEDVHITHKCPDGDRDLRVPDELRGPPADAEEGGD